jgi:ribosome-associated translation inhibitor RaiA
MKTPLQITFHQLPTSPALEADIRAWVEELDGLFDEIVSCRVVVEEPHRHHHQGRLFRVGVELGVPEQRLVVGRSPGADHSHEDAHVAVRDAFLALRRQLEHYVRCRRGEVKSHEQRSEMRPV